MGRTCCVVGCNVRSHDRRGRKIDNGISFYCFPAWKQNEGSYVSDVTKRRRMAWISAIRRTDIHFADIPRSFKVCSRHFHSGKPAYEMLESDPDWVPSLQLGHSEGNRRRTERLLLPEQPERDQKQRWTTETGPSRASRAPQRESGGPARPAVRPWRDVKPLLQSLLQRENRDDQPPAAKKMDLSFRDFFRDALEASLEASSRSRTLSARQPSVSRDYKVDQNFKLPPVKEENPTSSSCCLNCVRLQRRIVELQEKLSRLTGEQEDAEASPVFSQLQPDQDLQSPETVRIKEEEPAWTEPLSPPQVLLHEGDQDVDTTAESTPTGAAVSQDKSSERPKLRRPPRFKMAWLKMFRFLRYSQAFDQMWCHVCRLHADKSRQNLALIKGSRMFKVHNIKKHSDSKHHKDNLERHMLHTCDLKL
ncbi:uncharacterized protein LOC122874422 isoform X1 [Siniperca chuatsi]|uniref:uncharacterized protein LOC122874422 isoform X1 n=1 Tax=Siniperca chuatsi TaxID=119488 RepID=UPI001CE0302D|nr:uncharacterized protein LOC122874422 isoform X1 [Siniperca chuatsi]XP_044048212.1 uncharacterized protein LOC122874422 isoform X1 [Siniperca chuatsi]